MNFLSAIPNAPSAPMTCHELSERLAAMRPDLSPVDVARLTLMILNFAGEADLRDAEALQRIWAQASFRLEAAADQHAAVAAELDGLGVDGPIAFSPDQLWVLLRAVKVQSQILELYTDAPALA